VFRECNTVEPLDPLVKYLCQTGIGHTHFFRGRSDEAIIWTNKALSERPTFIPALRLKMAAAAVAGRTVGAQEALNQLYAVDPNATITSLMRFHPSRPKSQREPYDGCIAQGRTAGIMSETAP
jgi:hypothetical protein